jgi:N-methylhydantoinase A
MERAIRVISVERGHDPRRFSLVAFGGAGPMHACDLADALGIPTVIIPNHAGVLSALGLLVADVAKDFSQTVLRKSDEFSPAEASTLFEPIEQQAREVLADEGFSAERIEVQRFLDVRYVGQSYEVTVPATDDFVTTFHAEHSRLYGHCDPSWPVEVVNVRLAARGSVEPPQFPIAPEEAANADGACIGTMRTVFGGDRIETHVYDRTLLRPGNRFDGPAVVVELSATAVVAPGYSARIDARGHILMNRLRS